MGALRRRPASASRRRFSGRRSGHKVLVEQAGLFEWPAPFADREHSQQPNVAGERDRQDVPWPDGSRRLDDPLAVHPDVAASDEVGRSGPRSRHAREPEPFVQSLPILARIVHLRPRVQRLTARRKPSRLSWPAAAGRRAPPTSASREAPDAAVRVAPSRESCPTASDRRRSGRRPWIACQATRDRSSDDRR